MYYKLATKSGYSRDFNQTYAETGVHNNKTATVCNAELNPTLS